MQLRDALNIPDLQKTIENINREKEIMSKIVELVEQKNQLVEQLEALRKIAQEEDNHMKSFLGKEVKIRENEKLIDKLKYYSDII